MIIMTLIGWKNLRAVKNNNRQKAWMREVTREMKTVFVAGLMGSHSGRIYRRRGGAHQASAAGEYPANDSGALLSSMKTAWDIDEAKIGTNMPYSIYLRQGTPKGQMARRKMSDDALKEGAPRARHMSRGIVHWSKKRQ